MSKFSYEMKMDNFNALKVSTQTYIIHSNIEQVNLPSVIRTIQTNSPIIDEDEEFNPQIISATYKGEIKGVVKKKKSSPNTKRNFLNCVSITVQIELEKNINVKIFNNGVFQLTGCKHYDHAKESLIVVWAALREINSGETDPIFVYKNTQQFPGEFFQAYIISAMRNIDFRLGFPIDREKIGDHIQSHTTYKVSPMVNVFMGVKISVPIEDVSGLGIYKLEFDDEGDFTETKTTYGKFWEVKPEVKIKAQNKAISISVFQTGEVLMSGIDASFQEPVFKWFIAEVEKIKEDVIIKKESTKSFSSLIKPRKSKFHYKTVFQKVAV